MCVLTDCIRRSRKLTELSARIFPSVTENTFSAKCNMWAATTGFRLNIKVASRGTYQVLFCLNNDGDCDDYDFAILWA